jgi:hypothetical protein
MLRMVEILKVMTRVRTTLRRKSNITVTKATTAMKCNTMQLTVDAWSVFQRLPYATMST